MDPLIKSQLLYHLSYVPLRGLPYSKACRPCRFGRREKAEKIDESRQHAILPIARTGDLGLVVAAVPTDRDVPVDINTHE